MQWWTNETLAVSVWLFAAPIALKTAYFGSLRSPFQIARIGSEYLPGPQELVRLCTVYVEFDI